MFSFTPSICLHVALFCDIPERLSLYGVSKGFRGVIRLILYTSIEVDSRAANLVVRSLAKNPELPKFVECLWFRDRDTLIEAKYWARALPAMKNLWLLVIPGKVDIPRHLASHPPFQLRYFGAVSNVSGHWPAFLRRQYSLEEICINGEFRGPIPGIAALPALRRLRAQPGDMALLLQRHHTVAEIWFRTPATSLAGQMLDDTDLERLAETRSLLTHLRIGLPELLPIYSAIPNMLLTLQHLVLDEDLTWSAFKLETEDVLYLWESPLQKLAVILDTRFEYLESVFLIFNSRRESRVGNERKLLKISDAHCFASVFASYSKAPLFKTLRIQAKNGYAVCRNWDTHGIKYYNLSAKRHVQKPLYATLFVHQDEYF
ncbi:hypothetical protein R3P38DRAFT_3239327 [Favolaschia claudopus]|uniref:F-box domain-containing protein n=1 Tax=Favolaschia claudopus TaxID=2862362 RepID=A0AAV9Z7Z2_9AGAR